MASSAAKQPWYISPFRRIRYQEVEGNNSTELRIIPNSIKRHLWTSSSKSPIGEDQSWNDPTRRGWVQGVRLCAWCTAGILLVNIILTVIAAAVAYTRYEGQTFASGALYRGKCSLSKNWATGLHLVINVLSTAMLATSNYCMQCLTAPSRADVDRAHSQRMYLDIGVPSFGNFVFQKGWRRKLVWFLLLLTSLPIHLIYNSAIYFAVGPTRYAVLVAQTGHNLDELPGPKHEYEDCFEYTGLNMSSFYASVTNGDFEPLSKQECLDIFATDFVSGRGPLILQTSAQIAHSEPLAFAGTGNEDFGQKGENSFEWMCDKSCVKDDIDINNWTVDAGTLTFDNLEATYRTTEGFDVITTWSDTPNTDSEDLRRLGYLLDLERPMEEELRALLDDPDNWKNSSWASEVEIQKVGLGCSDPDYQEYTVDGCLSQRIADNCQLFFNPSICLIVIFCNAVKVICMFLASRDDRDEILLTAGDAISSFLARPDPTTVGVGLLSKADVRKNGSGWNRAAKFKDKKSTVEIISYENIPKSLPQKMRWMQAASWRRWFAIITMYLIILTVSTYLLSRGITDLKFNGNAGSLWDYGLGELSNATMITPLKAPFTGRYIIITALVANAPQLFVSAAYFLYNSLLSCMFLAAEQDKYSMKRKPLRVSWPQGTLQRRSYYLSLPYRYNLPLLSASALLHWLVSESIFFVAVVYFKEDGTPDEIQRYVECGYSLVSLIFAITLGGVLISVSVLLGFRRFKSRMPLAGSCSVAISAACHPLKGEQHALKPVMWGEVVDSSSSSSSASSCNRGSGSDSEGDVAGGNEDAVRRTDFEESQEVLFSREGIDGRGGQHSEGMVYPHCSFTSEQVIPPSESRLYR